METALGCLIACGIACLVTMLELDRTFYVPTKVADKKKLLLLQTGFVLINGVLAAGLFLILGDLESFKKQVEPWAGRATVVGFSYLALIRLKFATFQIQDAQYSFGIEALYEGLKTYFYKRINTIVRQARREETTALALANTPAQLSQLARNNIQSDNLLTAEKKKSLTAWVLKVEKDPNATEEDKKFILANFILSDRADGVE